MRNDEGCRRRDGDATEVVNEQSCRRDRGCVRLVARYGVVAHFGNNTWLFSSFVNQVHRAGAISALKDISKAGAFTCQEERVTSGNFRQCCAVLFAQRALDLFLLWDFAATELSA